MKLFRLLAILLVITALNQAKAQNNLKEPIYVINGKISTKTEMFGLDPNIITSVNILKGDEAVKKFGNKGANGVVEITLKYEYQMKLKEEEDNGIRDFASVEIMPEFPGGMAGWDKYLQKNMKYPPIARKNNITGRVIVAFVVEKNGDLSDIKVIRSIGGGCDEEAVRVLKTAPSWKPGIQNGRPVRVAYTMPIFFQLAK
jgi:TonB family protein